MTLQDSVCIVTGGGSGIGRATALLMAREGARIVVLGRTVSKVDAVVQEVTSKRGSARAYALDVADHDGVFAMAEEVGREYGRIDVLVNSAGHNAPHRRLLTSTPEEIRSVLDTVLIGTIYCTQAVLPFMLEAGRGSIINVSSLSSRHPSLLGGMIYSAAKAAVDNFTGFINEEYKDTNIRASAVIPGEVDTPIMDLRPVPPSEAARVTMVAPEDVAEAIALIARLPAKSAIPEMVIRPTVPRDASAETERFP